VTDADLDVPPPIVPGVARALSPLVRRIALDVDGTPGANTYLVGIDEIAVIDPGPDVAHHLDAIAGCGGDRVLWILSTGSGDQSGAEGLRKRTGAQIVAIEGIDVPGADETVADGYTLLGTEFRLVTSVVTTPAGTRALYFLEEERVLFAGDAVESLDLPDRRFKRLRAVAPTQGQLIEDL
jgi:glyoxylase-like metal-dependent hydrolase (beta-lactamase superfamily II)